MAFLKISADCLNAPIAGNSFSRLLMVGGCLAILSACVATPKQSADPDAVKMGTLANKTCSVTVGSDQYKVYSKDKFVVKSVTHGEGGWISGSAYSTRDAVSDNVYLRTTDGKFVCGTDNFRAQGFSFVRR